MALKLVRMSLALRDAVEKIAGPIPIAKELETFDKAIAEFFESADKFNPDA